ncbi:hypothetical protein [Undibacterium sp. TJN19]|uniref:hypothetical protein n=1 Tax=Undibacterium sp. TJN19 TaxID=3413055 RepID=UPI003BF242D4
MTTPTDEKQRLSEATLIKKILDNLSKNNFNEHSVKEVIASTLNLSVDDELVGIFYKKIHDSDNFAIASTIGLPIEDLPELGAEDFNPQMQAPESWPDPPKPKLSGN